MLKEKGDIEEDVAWKFKNYDKPYEENCKFRLQIH